MGYANYERYRGITLSPAGVKAAEAARKRYRIINDFLTATGAKFGDLQLESRRLESFCSDDVLAAFKAATNKLNH